jgi:beta-glucosidase-like glycosyl hydrolase/CubicO group peptidase (beta-lactamase class C family)
LDEVHLEFGKITSKSRGLNNFSTIIVLPIFVSYIMKRIILISALSILALTSKAQTWEDSLVKSMSLDEKIGQLFMIAAYSNKGISHTQYIEQAIKKYHIGGLIFFQGSVGKQVYLTNYYQNISKLPLFIGQDAEWGVNMRIKDVPKYPYSMTLGASRSNALAYETGRAMGAEMKRLGVHINFAPVADVNNNPKNPIIGFRSFGDNKENVAQKALAVVHGLQSERVIACAKHFPGHGNTGTDSHLDLPVLKQTRAELDSIELYPFEHLVKGGVMSAMVGHIHIPSIDNTPNLPASLSPKLVKNILQYEMNFQGLVFTDALNMKGVSKFFANGDAEVKALLAGNDILLYPNQISTAVLAIKKAIKNGTITENDINQKVKKILYYKRWVKLDQERLVQTGDILNDLIEIHSNSKVMELAAEQSITIVHNGFGFIPLVDSLKYLHISIGELGTNEFTDYLKKSKNITRVSISKTGSVSTAVNLKAKAKNFDRVIVSFHKPSIWSAKSYGYGDAVIRMARELAYEQNAALVLFCNPYLTKYFSKAKTIIVAYEDEKVFREEAARMLMGEKEMIGQLPFKPKNIEMDHWLPLSYFKSSGIRADDAHLSGLDTTKMLRIDYLLSEITTSGSAPGGQVLIAKQGKIVYEKSFGKLTYSSSQLVTPNTIFDLASITKVFASGLMGMKLYDQGLLRLDTPISVYIPELINKPLGRVKVQDLMLHQAGLPAWIPFYKATLPQFSNIYSSTSNNKYQIQVAEGMFMDTSYRDSMYEKIYSITPKRYGKYKYSDLSLILLKKAMENAAGQTLDTYVFENFYKPLGLSHTGFNMHRYFPKDSFSPSEQDNYFRNQTLQGHVHDMAAAMLGGVSGHAGLFSTTQDMFVLSEMLRNGGKYNQVDYLNPATIQLFSCKISKNSRRGLLFDKPEGRDDRPSPTSESCPIASFGHTGFTGTCVWIDPVNDIVYIFLSNRTYPSMSNRGLIRGNYRDKIQETIYNALEK